jgi:hypothetical protein
MAAQKTWFERARQVLSNLVVFLLPFVRRKGPLFTHRKKRLPDHYAYRGPGENEDDHNRHPLWVIQNQLREKA